MEQAGIVLVAGVGNPGNQYVATRHNVGFWLLERLQRTYSITLATEKKFKAKTGRFECNGKGVRVIAPDTFMNLSGQSIAPMASFYRIVPSQILVIHDELDLPPGSVRLKIGGGHGGHNGLRDIASKLGGLDFLRLRIGIGHPGGNKDVSGYVLSKPPSSEQTLIEDAIDKAISVLPDVLCGDYQKAMNQLHGDAEKDDSRKNNIGKDNIGKDKSGKNKLDEGNGDQGNNVENSIELL